MYKRQVYVNESLVDFFVYNSSVENKSFSLINESWILSEPTPGKENIAYERREDVRISIRIPDRIFAKVMYENPILIDIENKENCSRKDMVWVSYSISNLSYSFSRPIGCSGYADTGYIFLERSGVYEMCVRIINSSIKSDDQSNNRVCKNITVMENPLFIANYTKKLRFGDYGMISIYLNASYYPYNESIFLVCGREKRIIEDLNGDEVTCGKYEKGIRVDTSRDIVAILPFFIKPNCNSYYADGSYTIYLNVFHRKGKGFERYFEIPLNINIDGRNENTCKEVVVKRKIVRKVRRVFVRKKKPIKIERIEMNGSILNVFFKVRGNGNYTAYSCLLYTSPSPRD